MSTIPEAKKKGAVLCLMPIELPSSEGDIYAYMLLDIYSDFAINLGYAKSNSIEDLLLHLKKMFKNKDFKKIKQANFHLVLHKYEVYRQGDRSNYTAPGRYSAGG